MEYEDIFSRGEGGRRVFRYFIDVAPREHVSAPGVVALRPAAGAPPRPWVGTCTAGHRTRREGWLRGRGAGYIPVTSLPRRRPLHPAPTLLLLSVTLFSPAGRVGRHQGLDNAGEHQWAQWAGALAGALALVSITARPAPQP